MFTGQPRHTSHDNQTRKHSSKGPELPKICSMSFTQKIEELFQGTSSERRQEINDSLYGCLSSHNLMTYLPDIQRCLKHRGQVDDAYQVIQKKIIYLIRRMQPHLNPHDHIILQKTAELLKEDRIIQECIAAACQNQPSFALETT